MFLLALAAGAAGADTLELKNGEALKGSLLRFENGEFIFVNTWGIEMKIRADLVRKLVIERNPSQPQPGGRWEDFPPFDVRLQSQWIASPIRVSRGQQVRVNANGTIHLEDRTPTGPEGLNSRRDPYSPLPNQNDGALIASIGREENAQSLFIGASREFTADRDGLLHFTANHGETRNARGAFRVRVSVYRAAGAPKPPPNREKKVAVQANLYWNDTGVDVRPNMTIEINARGRIEIGNGRSTGPDGDISLNNRTSRYPMPGVGAGALIAKIRTRGEDSDYTVVGANKILKFGNTSGRLFLSANDDVYGDNSGSYTVTIRWQ